jgi:hypothetical protein
VVKRGGMVVFYINARSHRQRGRAQSHSQRHIANCPTRGR